MSSFPRKRESRKSTLDACFHRADERTYIQKRASRYIKAFWIPVFTGMTARAILRQPLRGENIIIHEQKEKLRRRIMKRRASGFQERWGKAAERVRRLDAYREANTIMVSLDPILHQVRLNVLSDRKELVLPSPGLHKGFILLEPGRIPVSKLNSAIRPHQSLFFGKRIPYDAALSNPIQIIIAEAVAVGLDGGRLGDGSGHLDLQCALLSSLGWNHSQIQIITVVGEDVVLSSIPMKKTDVRVHWIVTPHRAIRAPYPEFVKKEIIWENLSSKQIRRNDALFHLYRRRLTGEK